MTDTSFIQTDAGAARIAAGQLGGPVSEPRPPQPSPFEIWRRGGIKGWEARQLEEQLRHIALMSGLEQLVAHLGGILDASQMPPVADVLYQGTLLIPANGVLQLQAFKQNCESVAVANYGAAALSVQNAGLQTAGIAPAQGSGLVTVPAGTLRVFNMRGLTLTFYGVPGVPVDVCVYARPQPPAAGSLSTAAAPLSQELLVGAPAIGLNIVGVQPSTTRPFMVTSLTVGLNRAASGGNAIMIVQAVDASGHILWSVAAATVQAPSTNWFYTAAVGAGVSSASTQSETFALPTIWSPPGTTIQTAITNLAAGDQVSAASMLWASQ